jgi:hypothetical protein
MKKLRAGYLVMVVNRQQRRQQCSDRWLGAVFWIQIRIVALLDPDPDP